MTTRIDIAASNIHGMGATHLVESLFPALAEMGRDRIGTAFVPTTGNLGRLASGLGWDVVRIPRRLPNAISRVAECIVSSRYYPSHGQMLVLGDVPLALPTRQVVLMHRSHVISGEDSGSLVGNAKVAVSRWLIRRNARHVHRVIVQSELIADQLRSNFPELADRIRVLAQPAPGWLSDAKHTDNQWDATHPIRLFYPASQYPHKNHELLFRYVDIHGSTSAARFVLTIDRAYVDDAHTLVAIGAQGPEGMRAQYHQADALVFPSLEESYGLPLVEAMTMGLPIIVADRPYAHTLCGDKAIYFDATNSDSLHAAILELRSRKASGWIPDYDAELARIPADWNAVATQILTMFDGS